MTPPGGEGEADHQLNSHCRAKFLSRHTSSLTEWAAALAQRPDGQQRTQHGKHIQSNQHITYLKVHGLIMLS